MAQRERVREIMRASVLIYLLIWFFWAFTKKRWKSVVYVGWWIQMMLLDVNTHFIDWTAVYTQYANVRCTVAVPLVLQFVWHFASFKSQFIQFTTDSQNQIILTVFPFVKCYAHSLWIAFEIDCCVLNWNDTIVMALYVFCYYNYIATGHRLTLNIKSPTKKTYFYEVLKKLMHTESQFFDQNRLRLINESTDGTKKSIIERPLNALTLAAATKIMKMRTMHWLSTGWEETKTQWERVSKPFCSN